MCYGVLRPYIHTLPGTGRTNAFTVYDQVACHRAALRRG